ncbi:Type II/IV secretion system protein [Candidatus Norongarragalina meridionalis]|nr:Type II/IV secretion system protein [Candidatus Norongarragalina meridionalis]
MEGVGWKIGDGKSGYRVEPVPMSKDEERLLLLLTREFLDRAKEATKKYSKESLDEELRRLLKDVCDFENVLLNKKSADKIVSIAERNIGGFGVFDFLLSDDELEEITVLGVGQPIHVFHREKGWLETNCSVTSEEFATNVVNKMARSLGRRVTYQSPRLNAVLPDGSRLHASVAPVTLNGIEMTIRKFRQKPFTARDLIDNGTLSAEAAAFLWLALYGDVSVLVAGTTGSGKTTTLNALFSFIPLTDRVIITEETPEINIPHKHQVKIIANEELGIQMKDLVKDTLRMRPDRVIVGEVRDSSEAGALFDSLLAGQARGTYATFHAGNGDEALLRLQALGARKEDLDAIDLVIVQRRISVYDSKTKKQSEVRRVTEICEVSGGKAVPLFVRGTKGLEKTKAFASCALMDKISANYGMERKALCGEVAKRERFLRQLPASDFADFTERAQRYMFG